MLTVPLFPINDRFVSHILKWHFKLSGHKSCGTSHSFSKFQSKLENDNWKKKVLGYFFVNKRASITYDGICSIQRRRLAHIFHGNFNNSFSGNSLMIFSNVLINIWGKVKFNVHFFFRKLLYYINRWNATFYSTTCENSSTFSVFLL